jgi:SP family arabinose:H+ symporter-like MFS transporter
LEPIAYAPPGAANVGFIVFITSITAIGGFLFGYDTAVISGAVGFLETHFNLSPAQTGMAGASAIVGCIPGAMFAGVVSDRLGRKRVLLLCAVLYAVSGVASALPQTFTQFIVARFLGGLGIGASSMICPVYIAEIAPEKHRGRLGALFQLGIVTGIFLVFFVNLLIQRSGDAAWNTQLGWRWMLGSEAIPAGGFLFLLFFVPESPRWLAMHHRAEEARRVLTRFAGEEAADRELAAIASVSQGEEGRFRELFSPTYRRPLFIAVALAAFAQFSGINAVMYYAPEIFKITGRGTNSAFSSTVWVGAINLLFTFVAIVFVDKAGRKPLLAIGAAVQTVSLAAVGLMFKIGNQGSGVLLFILLFVAAFAMAMGPIPWIVISEIFPGRIRGRAASVGVLAIWVACYVVAQTFPVLKNSVGGAVTFWIYGACSLASLAFVLAVMPETKGRTLEEIEASWRAR